MVKWMERLREIDDEWQGDKLAPEFSIIWQSFVERICLFDHWSGAEASLGAVKEYCEKNSNGQVQAKDIDNVFKYVVPRSIFVMREPEDCVALMCDFRFELEHGMAIVLRNGKLDKITDQDSVV